MEAHRGSRHRNPLPCLLLACLLAWLPAAHAQGIGAEVRQALAQSQRVRVMVLLHETGDDPARATPEALESRVSRATQSLLEALPSAHYALERRFARVPAVALEVDAHALAALSASPLVRRVDLDHGGTGAMMQSRPIVRLDQVFGAGLAGAGAKIAVVDSGIDTDHPDFAGRIAGQQCFCSGLPGAEGCCPNGADTMAGPGSAEDDLGHGTHVTGVAAGSGSVAPRGAAPAAQVVAVKVLDAGNSFCCASDVVAALDWIATTHPDTVAVNTSLGTGALFAGDCDEASATTLALSAALDALRANGTQLFAASGNAGASDLIAAPACLREAIAVGATWDNNFGIRTTHGCTAPSGIDRLACFSNGNDRIDLVAPGAEVTSAGIGGGASTYIGTSQATPMVAGCAVALRAAFPGASPTLVKAALRASPTRVDDTRNGLVYPRLDCEDAALQLSVPGRLFFDGFQ